MFKKDIVTMMLVGTIIVLTISACKKDLGNYDYNPANVITISTDMNNVDPKVVVTNDSIVVKQNDSLSVDIILHQTKPSSDIVYEWSIIQSAANISNPPQYVVGTGKQLKTKIIVTPNLYKLVVKVTDRTTGVSFYKIYALNVDTSPWGAEGWVILQDSGSDGSDISVITTQDGSSKGVIYSNVYALVNGRKLPAGTNRVNIINHPKDTRAQKISFFYPDGGLQVRSSDFSDSSLHTSWFLIQPTVTNLQLNGSVNGGQYEYQINDNQIYYRKVNVSSVQSPPIKFGAPILGTWSLSPFVINNLNAESYFTLYDQKNKCFLLYNMETNTLIPSGRADIANLHFNTYSGGAAALLPTGSGFDLNNIGRSLVYTENMQPLATSGTPNYGCVFRNSAGDSTWLYQLPVNLSYTNNFTSGRFFLSSTNNPGINTATQFAFPTHLAMPGRFFYTNGNRIYTCKVATGATSTSSVGYTFPTGTVIKSMKVFKSGYATAPSNESRTLVVATDESASGGGHKVYFLSISLAGDLGTTPVNVYTGFDRIVDIAFKKTIGI